MMLKISYICQDKVGPEGGYGLPEPHRPHPLDSPKCLPPGALPRPHHLSHP